MASKRPKGVDVFPKVVEDTSPVLPSPTDLYAALDLGTNSCRMLIARPNNNNFQIIDSFSKSVNLGSGLEDSRKLSNGAMKRAISALKICQRKLIQWTW